MNIVECLSDTVVTAVSSDKHMSQSSDENDKRDNNSETDSFIIYFS